MKRLSLPSADREQIRYELPMPPSVNNMHANRPGIGRVKTKAYREWITEAGFMLLAQRNRQGKHKRIDGPIAVTVEAYRPANKRRDLDNILKPLLDLLTKTQTIKDDSQIVDIWARWVDEGVPCALIVESVE